MKGKDSFFFTHFLPTRAFMASDLQTGHAKALQETGNVSFVIKNLFILT